MVELAGRRMFARSGAGFLRESMGNLLFEVSPTDRPTFAAVAFFAVVIGTLASFVPARRAMGADPMEALRGEL